jgi:dynein heavy chain
VDPASDGFTLDSVMALRLDAHAELIAELSVNASKEAAIEASLQGIAGTWASLPLDLAEYKSTHKLRSTEDVGRGCWLGHLQRCAALLRAA